MTVGQEKLIHAVRGDCGKMPPTWETLERGLDKVLTGTFSDGGLVRRNSVFCKGLTPARAVRFTATTPGVEEFQVQGDRIKMTVKAAVTAPQ